MKSLKRCRDAAKKSNVPIGATQALLDAARRYENRNCAIFKECTLPRCEGGVWCSIYNLGGSHGRIGDAFRHLGRSAFDIPLAERRKLMLEMLDYKARKAGQKCTKGAVKGRKANRLIIGSKGFSIEVKSREEKNGKSS